MASKPKQCESPECSGSDTDSSKDGFEVLHMPQQSVPSDEPPIAVEDKLDNLICEVTGLTSTLSQSVATFENRFGSAETPKREQTIENRVASLEDTMGKVYNGPSFQTMNERLIKIERSMDQLVKRSLQTFDDRLHRLETLLGKMQNKQQMQSVDNRLNNLEGSLEKLHKDLSLHTIDGRFNKLESMLQNHAEQSQEIFDKQIIKFEELKSKHDSDQLRLVKSEGSLEEMRTEMDKQLLLVDGAIKDDMTFDDAVLVLPIANRCGMKHLAAKISSVLQNSLTVLNCVKIFQLASQYELEELSKGSQQMILDNFKVVSETSKEFCNLSFSELSTFVFSDAVCATEEHIFHAIRRWILSDLANRRHHALELLPAVRVSQCSLKFLTDIKEHFLVYDQMTFHDAVQTAAKQLTSGSEQFHQFANEWRRAPKYQDGLFVIGGFSCDGIMEVFNSTQRSWVAYKLPQVPSDWVKTVSFGSVIFVFTVDRLCSFDLLTKKWTTLKPLPVNSQGLCLSENGAGLYALGGKGLGRRAFYYNIEHNTWTEVVGMQSPRSNASAAALRGKIFCAGGEPEPGGKPVSSVEVYDPSKNCWFPAASMSTPRAWHCVVSYKKHLWAVGGWNGTACINDLERYDLALDLWIKMKPMSTARHSLSVTVYKGQLYTIGGSNNFQSLGVTEVYNPDDDTWTKGAPLCKARKCQDSCVVRCLVEPEDNKVVAACRFPV